VLCATATFTILLDWRLALIALPILPLFIVPTRRVGKKRKKLKRTAQARLAELTGILSETLSVSGALLLKVFGTEELEAARLHDKTAELRDLSLAQTLVGRWFQMLLQLFENAGPALVFAGGGWLIIHGHLELGTVVAFVTLLKRLYNPASQLAGVHVDLVTSYAYFDRIFAVLDLEPAIKDAPDAQPLAQTEGRITFRGVTFGYTEGDRAALADLDVDILPGQSVALVGPSGAGKSTFISLVPRLYDPTAGAVLVDGRDLRTMQVKTLRAHIGVVLQDTYLFHSSIRENLRYARPSATDAEVQDAARAAQIHDFIASLPAGYDTLVGERGYRLSGGERQRLAIARAILKDPKILLLDEATSALDSTNEAMIQTALEPLLAGRTSIVIAHRLSTIRKANLILVLDEGRIVERGTHAELLARGGLYARLHTEQFGGLSTATATSA
jgi:ATP-binding cassette subfamily B protein